MKKEGKFLLLILIVLLVSLIILFVQNKEVKTTGFATTGTTVSNVTISKYLSITMSANLSTGIFFGTVNTLPAVNMNASSNNNSNSIGNSSFFLNVSTDSNTAVDFCIKANANLTDSTGGNILGLANESYSNSTIANQTMPDVAKEVPLNASYFKAGVNVSIGNVTYYRFYLDIPVGTPSGTYNNTINFQGVEAGVVC